MHEIAIHLTEIELALVSSPAIADYSIVRSKAGTDDGYIRIRATLVNGDFLEAVEYFVLVEGGITTIDYRHQWMDQSKQLLRKRWDCAPDHPHIPNFPYHVHVGDEATIQPGSPLSLIELLNVLELEITKV
jgi:hypothetical protein